MVIIDLNDLTAVGTKNALYVEFLYLILVKYSPPCDKAIVYFFKQMRFYHKPKPPVKRGQKANGSRLSSLRGSSYKAVAVAREGAILSQF